MVLLDANVLLELLLPNRSQSKKVIEYMRHSAETHAISMLTVHLAFYFGRKGNKTIAYICQFLEGFIILDLTDADYQIALETLRGEDIEDALQLATAIRTGCSGILTLDHDFAKRYEDTGKMILVS